MMKKKTDRLSWTCLDKKSAFSELLEKKITLSQFQNEIYITFEILKFKTGLILH